MLTSSNGRTLEKDIQNHFSYICCIARNWITSIFQASYSGSNPGVSSILGFRITVITEESGPSYMCSIHIAPTNLNLINMKINCPKCQKETEFFTKDSISEDGEVFKCQHCGWPFRFVFDHIKKK